MGMMRTAGRALGLLYRRGFALFVLAPVIVAVVVLPEFLQHIAEIRLGMFDSREAAHALANDPTRWAFGYAKLAGLALAMFAAARFWLVQRRGCWWRLGDVAWLQFVVAAVLFLFVPTAADPMRGMIPEWAYYAVVGVLSLARLPLLFAAMAALAGKRDWSLLRHYRRDWRWIPLLLVLLVAAYAPLVLHYGFHRLALGAPKLVIWPLMAMDALTVGLLASLVGAAFSVAYESARTPASAGTRA
jgi:hypothetical protein